MTADERAALRVALIVSADEAILSAEEAAAVMDVSSSWLLRSDVPRAPVAGVKFLKSQCLLYVKNRLTHTLEPLPRSA